MQRRLLLAGSVAGATALPFRPGLGTGAAARDLVWDMVAGGNPARPYRIFLRVPAAPPPAEGYPVFYMLDGEAQFGLVEEALRDTGSHEGLSLEGGSPGEAPGGLLAGDGTGPVVPGLVVAIGYRGKSRREHDYTPPSEGGPPEEGGAEGFLDFIERELKPRVEAAFPADRRRQALFGHSYGGLFALYALFTRPGSFHRTVAASPSIWYGNGAVLRAEERFAANPPPEAASLELLVTVGELEGGRPGSAGADSDLARVAQQVERARALSDRLGVLGERGPRMRFHIFPGKDHGSVIPVALRRGLRFAFRPG